MKTCTRCGETKPLSEFSPRKDAPCGVRSACKPCQREDNRLAMQRWRADPTNYAASLERWREWRDADPEKDRARCNRYDAANREKRRQAIAAARKANPEYHRALRRAWREANIELSRARCRAYWHRKRTGSAPSPEIDEYAELLLKQPCAYCGSREHIEIDHIVPVSRGGKHVPANLAPCCRRCNSSKGAKPLDDWDGPPDAS